MQVTRTAPSGCLMDGLWQKVWGWRDVWTKRRFFRGIVYRARDARLRRGAVVASSRSVGFDSRRKCDSDRPLPGVPAGILESRLDLQIEFRIQDQEFRIRSGGRGRALLNSGF